MMRPLYLIRMYVLMSLTMVIHEFYGRVSAQSKNPAVEGFAGGSVTLPCTLTGTGTLEWKSDSDLILIKPPGGSAVIVDGPFRDSVELSGQSNLLIRSLTKARDNNREFTCTYVGGMATQVTPVRVLEKISEAAIQESVDNTIAVTEGVSKTLTCTVTGDPNPAPAYSWRVEGGPDSGQGWTFSLTADRSMTTVTCTATNTYSNGTELSRKEVTSSLNVLYLDDPAVTSPVTVIEGESVTLRCSAEGNPPPEYEWRRSGSTEVISTSGPYPMDTVYRSAAGEYTCTVSNSVWRYSPTVNLIVQYPPGVTVTFDEPSQTLSCSADGVPANYSFRSWEHRLGGKLLQTLGTASTQSPATLRLEHGLTYEDTGSYVCQVTNRIKGVQSGQVVVRPETVAIFQAIRSSMELRIGEIGMIHVPFYTHSKTGAFRVEWRRSGGGTPLTSHREQAGPVSLLVRGHSVSIEGTVTVLTLSNVTRTDQGNYTVTVTSDIGANSESSNLVVTVNVYDTTNTGQFPDVPGEDVGGVVGGAVTAAIAMVVAVVVIVFLYRRKKGLSETASHSRNTAVVTDGPQSGEAEGRVYEGLSDRQDYINTGTDQPYTTMRKNTYRQEFQDSEYELPDVRPPHHVELTSSDQLHPDSVNDVRRSVTDYLNPTAAIKSSKSSEGSDGGYYNM